MRSDKTILIVDDDVHIRRVIQLKLESAGYKIITACNGREAAEIVKQERPDAMITDLTMPDVNGKQLCEMTNPLKRDRPFLTIVLTARIMPEEQAWIQTMTNTFFMEKPFSSAHLLKFIDKQLEIEE